MGFFIVTGASQGIGKAVAVALSGLPNAHVALLARNQTNLENVAQMCRKKGASVTVAPCNVTDENQVNRTADRLLADSGPADILVNNAGFFKQGSFLETTPADFNQQISVNLTSAFYVTRAFLPAMIEARRGHVFFMASVASIRAYAGGVAYCAAKHGLLGLARVVREEMRDKSIRVTTLLPGATLTPSWEGAGLPDDRFIDPEDIAATVVDIYRLSHRTVVEEIVIRPQLGDI